MLGIGTYLAPLGITLAYLGFSLLVHANYVRNGASPAEVTSQTGRGILGLLENGLPLVAGLTAAFIVQSDPAIELHLTLPHAYRGTMGRRITLLLLWSVALCAVIAGLTIATGYWVVPVIQPPLEQLTWLTPVCWYIAAGAFLALLLRSRTASVTILGALWIVQFLFKNYFLNNAVPQRLYLFLTEELVPAISKANAALWYNTWLANRLILLGIAVVFFIGITLLLRSNEYLLGHEA